MCTVFPCVVSWALTLVKLHKTLTISMQRHDILSICFTVCLLREFQSHGFQYILYIFLNISRAVCSWYLLPSCMVKLFILFPEEKLCRSMCKHSTWQPFQCAHRYCVCKVEKFGNSSLSRWRAKVLRMLIFTWNRACASCTTDCHSNESFLQFGPKNNH